MFSLPSAPAADGYVDVAGSVEVIPVTEAGFQRVVLTAPVVLQRGDVVVVQGPLGKR